MTEQEQIQQIKNWIKQYGVTILLGIVLAFAISSGWHYWQNYKNKVLLHASAVYDEMINLRAQSKTSDADVQAQKLIRNYPKTPYASMAAFMLARDAVIKKNDPEAINQLTWVMDHSKDASLRQIARLRVARILINEKKSNNAPLELLKTVDDDNFMGLIDEVRGDAYLAMNNLSAAKAAYEHALKELPNAEVTRPILQMKLDNIATT